MEYPEDFTINCSNCGLAHIDVIPLGADEWLSTCRDCSQQDVLTDGDLAQARQAGHKTITGKPLSRTATQAQKTNPVVRNAESRAAKTQVENPLIKNALKRAGETKTEVHHV